MADTGCACGKFDWIRVNGAHVCRGCGRPPEPIHWHRTDGSGVVDELSIDEFAKKMRKLTGVDEPS